MRRLLLALGAALVIAGAAPSAAQLASAPAASARLAERAGAFARKVEEALAERAARVAVVGRIGRDPRQLPPGLLFTHVGFWVYADITARDGRRLPGYAVYNLYQDEENPDRSYLRQDFPGDFFGDVHEMRASVIVPAAELQARLLETIASPTYTRLHNPRYSAVANPTGGKFQNCTGFVLEVLTAAIYRTDDKETIRANLKAYFEPTPIRIGGLQRFAAMLTPGVATSDHGDEIRTATFESIGAYLQRWRLASDAFEIRG